MALMYGYWGFPALGIQGCGLATSLIIWLQLLALTVYIRCHGRFRFPKSLIQGAEFDAPVRFDEGGRYSWNIPGDPLFF